MRPNCDVSVLSIVFIFSYQGNDEVSRQKVLELELARLFLLTRVMLYNSRLKNRLILSKINCVISK